MEEPSHNQNESPPTSSRETARELLRITHMNVAAAYRRLPDEERADVTYATFCRAVRREISTATAADIIFGDAERKQHELTLLRTYPDPFALLSVDEKQISILVGHPVTGLGIQPWSIHFRDVATGGIAGSIQSPDPIDEALFLEAMRDALRLDSDLGPFGGTPAAMQWDQAACHLGDAVTLAVIRLQVPVLISDGYHPQQNGIVESFHRFVESDYAKCHPFYQHGAEKLDETPCNHA